MPSRHVRVMLCSLFCQLWKASWGMLYAVNDCLAIVYHSRNTRQGTVFSCCEMWTLFRNCQVPMAAWPGHRSRYRVDTNETAGL
jgi:hypothetical protein